MSKYEEDDDIIEVDIKSIVSKKIAGKIQDLEELLAESREINNKNTEKYYAEIGELKRTNKELCDTIEKTHMITDVVTKMRANYASLERDPYVSGQRNESKASKQFTFIKRLMKNLYNVKTDFTFCDGNLETNLSIAFYDNKAEVINLLKMLDDKSGPAQLKVETFVMPYDYDKETVRKIIENPQSNVNGSYTGGRHYWVEYGGGQKNMPWDLFLLNKHILEDDIFELLCQTAVKQYGQSYLCYMLPRYNHNTTLEQIVKLGRCLMQVPASWLNYNEVEHFVSKNLHSFDEATLVYFSKFTSGDNHFKLFHWDKFPPRFQFRFLLDKPLEEILKLVTCYSNKWEPEIFEEFFEVYYKNKKKNADEAGKL